jgi:hypothetical protein
MKKLLMILVMVSWCSVGVAEVIKYNCKNIWKASKSTTLYTKYTLDTDNKTLFIDKSFIKDKDKKTYQESMNIVSWEGTNIVYNYPSYDGIFTFDYSNDPFIESLVKDNRQSEECTNAEPKKLKKIEIASMIDDAKDTCKSLGFNEGTEKFSDCALKLYSQSVELAAKQNQQIVMQPQSSGSNVMTIYDPVRDSNALMDKGMKMITGRCTLGYDC